MNVLVISNKPPYPPKDGGAIATFGMAKAMAENGHQVTLLSLNTSKHYIDTQQLPVIPNLEFIYIDINTDIKAFKAVTNFLFSTYPYNAQRFKSKELKKRTIALIKSQSFDIVQFEGPYLMYLQPVIRKYSKAKIVLRAHNVEHEIWQRTALNTTDKFNRFYFSNLANRIKKLEIKLLNQYDILVPITARDQDYFNELGNTQPSYVAPAGVDVSTLKYVPEILSYPSICYIGALDWSPNQEGLLWFVEEVWPLIHKELPNAEFVIAGRNAPQWLADKFKVKGIKFIGEIEEAQRFLNEHAVMVAPLFSGSGMRVKIIEGMVLGKAIVTTAIGAEGIAINNGNDIIIADTADNFAQQVVTLLTDEKYYQKIADNARIFALTHFNNTRIVQSLTAFYQKQIK